MGQSRSFIALALLIAGGCASVPSEPVVKTVEVKVPVATPVYCDVPSLADPALPIADLTEISTPDMTVRAYAASVAVLEGAVKQRDAYLTGCARPK